MKINPKFEAALPYLSKEEYAALKLSIQEEGQKEPIRVWNGTIVDGHHRYKICQELNKKPKTLSINFENEEEAYRWILKNQSARRNQTKFQKLLAIGRYYNSIKKEVGRPVNEPKTPTEGVEKIGHCDLFNSRKYVAQKFGVSDSTVKRAANLAINFEKLIPYLQDFVNNEKLTIKNVNSIAQLSIEEQTRLFDNKTIREIKSLLAAPKKESPKESTIKYEDLKDVTCLGDPIKYELKTIIKKYEAEKEAHAKTTEKYTQLREQYAIANQMIAAAESKVGELEEKIEQLTKQYESTIADLKASIEQLKLDAPEELRIEYEIALSKKDEEIQSLKDDYKFMDETHTSTITFLQEQIKERDKEITKINAVVMTMTELFGEDNAKLVMKTAGIDKFGSFILPAKM